MAFLRRPDREPIRLTDPGVTIGRDPTNGVTLEEDKLVSRSHAEIVVRNEQWYLVDLGSRNGSLVNGRPVHRYPLRDGDIIGIGSRSSSSFWSLIPTTQKHSRLYLPSSYR
jgi:pSer/pThr/pTyr-binding forkhead associated (FHA) protein